MQPSTKYHIHADIRTDGVVERSDVVGAIFGQTEGLLGDELDLRELQDASKVGRINVDIDSEDGRSFGTVTIASGLGRVETAVLAAALETMDRVGPCQADCTITGIEDARAARRREIIDRATNLLADVDEAEMAGERLVEEVRKQARVETITEYEGLPAGPRVADSDAIIVVEGRADVRQLLQFGIKNAIAVEGTDVPGAVGTLSSERKTTAFLDGDRGGDLILQELRQVGDIDYVAFAPPGQSVEDLARVSILSALRRKLPVDQIPAEESARERFGRQGMPSAATTRQPGSAEAGQSETKADLPTDGGAVGAREHTSKEGVEQTAGAVSESGPDSDGVAESIADSVTDSVEDGVGNAASEATPASVDDAEGVASEQPSPEQEEEGKPGSSEAVGVEMEEDPATGGPEAMTLADHVSELLEGDSGKVRLLDGTFEPIVEGQSAEAFDLMKDVEPRPHSVVVDGPITQRLLDIAAQRGIGQLVGTNTEEFVKRPTSVRVRTADEFIAKS